MIKVSYKEKRIVITGHAGFAETGKDIVCASVSSIIYTTVNGILQINPKSILFRDERDVMTITIQSTDNITITLINNMVELLQEVERQYPEMIKISKGE